MMSAAAAEPLVVAYVDSPWHAALVEAVVYDDGIVVAANRSHLGGGNRTPWPNAFVVGRLAPIEVYALTTLVDGSLAGHDGRILESLPLHEPTVGVRSGGASNGGCGDDVYVIATFTGTTTRWVGYHDTRWESWFSTAWNAVLHVGGRASAPYRAERVKLMFDPIWSPTADPVAQGRRPPRHSRELVSVPLPWVPCDGKLCAVTTRSQYDAWFPRPCGDRTVEDLVRVTSEHWCSLVRSGEVIGKLYARELLPGQEQWEPCAPISGTARACATEP